MNSTSTSWAARRYALYKVLIIIICIFFFFFQSHTDIYGSSLARGQIRAEATGLQHSHRNARSEPRLWPTPQLKAKPDP